MQRNTPRLTCLALPALLLAAGLVPAGEAPTTKAPVRNGYEVEIIRNVAYHDGKDADPVRHRLDMYLPKGAKDYPVLFFVHGGAWQLGNKNHLGVYAVMGKTYARNGIGFVSTNYRLSPKVQHPEHIKDVARAFAWTHKHIGKHGGRADELFVAGHSAGGHLSALLATDETYLKAHGLGLKDVRGAMPISGVYVIPPHKVLEKVFGKDPEVLRQAGAMAHVCAAAPPFLICYADSELPGCEGPAAEAFCRALRDKGCVAATLEAKKSNHMAIIWNATSDTDATTRTMMGFIVSRVALHRLESRGGAGVDYLADVIARWAAE